MKHNEYKTGRKFVCRLNHGEDLLSCLSTFLMNKGIIKGFIHLIGAVQKANIGYYDQKKREYKTITFDEGMEILSGTGNISLKDGTTAVHMHMVLARSDGSVVGGHLMEDTIIFAGEAIVQEICGPNLERHYDDDTGLSLWFQDVQERP